MPYICFYFQIHQPFRLRNYSFFDIGKDHYYYDDYLNESILQKVAQKCYLPANNLMLKLIEKHGTSFKISYSISGSALDQFELYAPEVIESFQRLAKTGNVEFLCETYGHTLASQGYDETFGQQIQEHAERIEQLFGLKPQIFRNTELIYSDKIGEQIYKLGFKGMLTEGAKHILGWKSPNFLYYNACQPKLKLLLRNYNLSDDIAFRFSNKAWDNYPLTPEKFTSWLTDIDKNEELVNLFLDYETFGEHQWAETGIFEFMESLPGYIIENTNFKFETPSYLINMLQPVAAAHVPYPISWADEERDLTAWLGNDMQQEAFSKLYELEPYIKNIDNEEILQDWDYLQTSDHFYYMSTKWFSDGEVHAYFNPYKTPYDAFINYMNVLSDFTKRVKETQTINKKDVEIEKLNNKLAIQQAEIDWLKKQLKKKKRVQSTLT